jgi:hypothetical protein
MYWYRRMALNRLDLGLGVFVFIAGTPIVVWLLWAPLKQGQSDSIAAAALTGWIVILLACLGGAAKITLTRQTIISLFASEIRAIQYGLAMMDMFAFWAALYKAPQQGQIGFADKPRAEQYFETFHSVGSNVGNLHPDAVEAIVRFYTYLKMSRDAAAGLANWATKTDLKGRQDDVRHVITILAQSMLWGFVALYQMGFRANEQDKQLRITLASSYDKIREPDSFAQLEMAHVRSRAIQAFFG